MLSLRHGDLRDKKRTALLTGEGLELPKARRDEDESKVGRVKVSGRPARANVLRDIE